MNASNLKYAFRTLISRPGFSLVAVLSLALGIGATTTVFSVLDALVLRPLPFDEPGRILLLWQNNVRNPEDLQDVSPGNFVDWRRQNRAFSRLAAYEGTTFNLAHDQQPEEVRAVRITPGFFEALEVAPQLGRLFEDAQAVPGADRVVLLSQDLWQRRFGADPGLVGRAISLDDEVYTVQGVMPDGWYVVPGVDLWVPLGWAPDELQRDNHYLRAIGRLADGVSVAQAREEMANLGRRLAEEYPEENAGFGIFMRPLDEMYPSQRDTRLLMIMMLVVLLVLAIACANVANLLLARASSRTRELAVRSAFGAGRWSLMRLLLTESVVLSLCGGLVGILLAVAGSDLVTAALPSSTLFGGDVAIDARVLVFTLVVSVIVGLFFGSLPALRATRVDLRSALHEGGRSGSLSTGHHRLGRALVSVEIAVALVLLTLSILLIQSFLAIRNADTGFEPENLLTARLSLPVWRHAETQFSEDQQVTAFFRRVYERLASMPGVEAVGGVSVLPRAASDPKTRFTIEGAPAVLPGDSPIASWRAVSLGYFGAMGIPLIEGRLFEETDRFGHDTVVVVSRTLAERFFPDRRAIGEQLVFFDTPREIVGVVEDVLHTRDTAIKPLIYMPHAQSPRLTMHVVLRTSVEPEGLAASVSREVWQLDAQQPVTDIMTYEQFRDREFAGPQVIINLLRAFALIALVLAATGLYGLVSYLVHERTREFGIRMAIGGRRSQVLANVLSGGLWMTVVGLGAGLVGFLILRRVLTGALPGLLELNVPLLGLVVAALLAVALAASFGPAWRATRVDPMVALRQE